MVKPKIIIVTQARVGSTRFPEKILKTIGDKSLLSIHLQRLKKSILADKIIVATTFEEKSYLIKDIAIKEGVDVFQGSTYDVLDRFYQAVKNENAQYIVRVTSDCPLIDAQVIDEVLEVLIHSNYDYLATGLIPSFPDGISIEAFTFASLEKAHNEAELQSEREHVTPYIWKNSTLKGGNLFKSFNYSFLKDYSNYRLTVDTVEDFQVIEFLITNVGLENNWIDYVNYLMNHKEILEINSKYKRNEGYIKSINNDFKI